MDHNTPISKIETCAPAASLRSAPDRATLAELAAENILLCYYALVHHGRLPTDPVMQWILRQQQSDIPGVVVSRDVRLFSGLDRHEDGLWNHALLAVPRDRWPDLCSYLDSIVFYDKKKKFFWRVLRQKLPVRDFRSTDPFATVEIQAYGIDGNKFCLHFRPAASPDRPVSVVRDAPDVETVQAAAFYANGPVVNHDGLLGP